MDTKFARIHTCAFTVASLLASTAAFAAGPLPAAPVAIRPVLPTPHLAIAPVVTRVVPTVSRPAVVTRVAPVVTRSPTLVASSSTAKTSTKAARLAKRAVTMKGAAGFAKVGSTKAIAGSAINAAALAAAVKKDATEIKNQSTVINTTTGISTAIPAGQTPGTSLQNITDQSGIGNGITIGGHSFSRTNQFDGQGAGHDAASIIQNLKNGANSTGTAGPNSIGLVNGPGPAASPMDGGSTSDSNTGSRRDAWVKDVLGDGNKPSDSAHSAWVKDVIGGDGNKPSDSAHSAWVKDVIGGDGNKLSSDAHGAWVSSVLGIDKGNSNGSGTGSHGAWVRDTMGVGTKDTGGGDPGQVGGEANNTSKAVSAKSINDLSIAIGKGPPGHGTDFEKETVGSVSSSVTKKADYLNGSNPDAATASPGVAGAGKALAEQVKIDQQKRQ